MSHKQRVSASLTALTVKQKVLPLHFLIPNNFHVTASTNLGGSTLGRAEDIVLSGLTTRKEFLCTSPQQYCWHPPSISLKIQMWLTNVYFAHVFPVLHQQGCDLSVAIGICSVHSSCPQLLIASAFPCISLDDFFCLVCKWIQVLSQHTGPSLCPVVLALTRVHQQPYHWPMPPAGSHPSGLGAQLHLIYNC